MPSLPSLPLLRLHHTGQLSQNSEFTVALSKFLTDPTSSTQLTLQTLLSTVEDVSWTTIIPQDYTDL